MTIVAERLELLDGRSIIVAIVNRRIGRAVALGKRGIVDGGLLVVRFLGLVSRAGGTRRLGFRHCRGSGVHKVFTDATATAATTAAGGKSRNNRGRSHQR